MNIRDVLVNIFNAHRVGVNVDLVLQEIEKAGLAIVPATKEPIVTEPPADTDARLEPKPGDA